MTQQTLNFDSAREAVRKALSEQWLANHELPRVVYALTGVWYSEGGLAARVRDLKKAKYGGLTIMRERVPGKSFYCYRVAA